MNARHRPLLLALVCAAPAAVAAVVQLGRIHPDEVFQALEPATFRAFGYGTLAWEWTVGLRNWAVPGLFAGLLKACAAVGLDHPQARRAVLELPQYALHVAMLLAAFRFSERRVGAPRALWAIPLVGLTGLIVHFAGRTIGESRSDVLREGAGRAADGGLLGAGDRWRGDAPRAVAGCTG